jgi:excisionase family DNA binding protein
MEVRGNMLNRLFNRNRPEPTSQPDLMTLRQAAALLGVSREWVRILVKRKEIRGENRHGRWVVFQEDVITYEEQHPFAKQQRSQSKRLWAKAQNQKLLDKQRAKMGASSGPPLFDADGNRVRILRDEDGNVIRKR